MGEHDLTARHPPSLWRAGCLANGHVRFGRRAAETGQWRLWHRAAVRPHNLVCDLDFLAEGWLRVRANAGSRTPGIDKSTVADIENRIGAGAFVEQTRDSLKSGEFRPEPVRQVRRSPTRRLAASNHLRLSITWNHGVLKCLQVDRAR